MLKSTLGRGTLRGALATIAVISCSSNSNQPDPYNGVDYASDQGTNNLFDSKFLAQTCGNSGALGCRDSAVKYACPTSSPCYPVQQGYANGQTIYFYNIVSMSTTITPTKTCVAGAATCASGSVPNPIPTSVADPQLLGGGGMHVDNFPHSCVPKTNYNPVTDAYSSASQFPVFNALPAATTAFGAIVYPIVATYGVTLTDTETCNDIKDSTSIADASNPGGGSYGATRTAQPVDYEMWAPIDPNTVPKYVAAIPNSSYVPSTGWYQGLQVPFLNGGHIPFVTNSDGSQNTSELAAMEGVIVDPAGSSFSDVTDQKVILLPAAPGDPAYSPIVRLHDYHLQTGQTIGTVTSICTSEPCPASSADFSKASASPYYVIFIAAPPQ